MLEPARRLRRLISVGQQTYVGLGGYGLFAGAISLNLDPLLSALLATVAVTALALPVGIVVLRMQAPTSPWSPGWWRRSSASCSPSG